MKYGYFANIHDPSQSRDYGDMIAELRELAQLCDKSGFETFWLPEHHFSVWGRELLGNPLMMLADLGARTQRIRLGLAAAIITFWHPFVLPKIWPFSTTSAAVAWRSVSAAATTGWRQAISIRLPTPTIGLAT